MSDPTSPDWIDGYETAAAESNLFVREELAKLGGHLLSVYGNYNKELTDEAINARILATLGGYLLQHYGEPDAE